MILALVAIVISVIAVSRASRAEAKIRRLEDELARLARPRESKPPASASLVSSSGLESSRRMKSGNRRWSSGSAPSIC